MIRQSFLSIAVFFFLITCVTTSSPGQDLWSAEARTAATVNTSGASPFWFHSNQYGLYDKESSNLLQGFSLHKDISDKEFFDYGVGADLVGRFSSDSKLFFNELYGEARLGFLHFYAGKKEWKDGIWTPDLSLGSMTWSGNAATMPKVVVEVPQYTYIPLTKNLVAFRGYLGHGWFGDDRYVEGTYLHEKALYLRFLPESFVVNGHIGVIHNVQWGGTHPQIGSLPDGFKDYLRIFSGRAGEATTSPGGEVVNALGNTVGAYEARLDVDFDNVDVTAYRQFFIETSVSTRFRSPWDGQWGLELDFQESGSGILNTLLWEHMNTKRQNAKSGETIGADRYYHNFIYRNGWSYRGRILGSPLVSLGTINGREEVINNIIIAHHLGIEGELPVSVANRPINYSLMTTYSRSYGRTTACSGDFCDEDDVNPYRTPRQDQWYMQLQLKNDLSRRVTLTTAIGLDAGDLSNEFGLFFGVKYSLLKDS